MKGLLRFLSIATIACIIGLSACKDDDPVNPLIGTWIFVSETTTGCSDPDFNGTETCSTSCDEIVFTATTITDDTGTYDYSIDGNKVTFKISFGGVSIPVTNTFSISGDQLTVTDETDTTFGCKTVLVLKKKS